MVKKIAELGILFILLGILFSYKDKFVAIMDIYLSPKTEVELGEVNPYYRNYDFLFVQTTKDFEPMSYQDIINIYYTVINAGKTSFTFYCPKEYTNCVNDIQSLANDQTTLSDINNYVHPFNAFSHIETTYDSLGRITIDVVRSYSEEDVLKINTRVDELYNQLVVEGAGDYNNILKIHDYIVNHTVYDSQRSDYNIVQYKSDIAYGPLFEGYAICGGYTDLMQLFLEKMGIKNFRVSSEKHVWNAVFYNNQWYNLDLTWDDPVTRPGINTLEHNYFMLPTSKLLSIETTEHVFDFQHYPELDN